MTADIISLSQGVRASLLSSQSVAAQQAEATARLASGLKVKTALDNPTNFFTSRSLDARATELNGLLDGFSNARSTIQAAVDAQEKVLELLDVAEAAREGGWQALKRGEYKNLTRVATVVTGNSMIQPGETQAAVITGLNAAVGDDAKIAFLESQQINRFHSVNSATQQFFISVGESDRGSAASYRSTNTGNKTYGQFMADLEAAIPGLEVKIIRDKPNPAAADDNSQFKMQMSLPEKDDRAIYMTGWFNIFQNLNIDHGIYWSDDPNSEKTLLSFDALPAGWENTTIPNNSPGFHITDGYPNNSWVLDDGVNPELMFMRGTHGTTLGDFVDYVNAEYTAGRFGFKMEQINDAGDPDDGKLQIYTDGAKANRLLFKPRLEFVFQNLLIDGNTGGAGTPYSINNPTQPPAPGIPAPVYDIDNDYWDQYETARTQIDDIIADGSFNGTALGKADRMTVDLNERGSRLDIEQREVDARALGIAKFNDYEFQMFDRLEVIREDTAKAREIVKARLTELRAELAIIDVREKFTKDLVNVLKAGSAKLTLADSNEEGAKLLASNTRQQLTGVALQLASQADQNVLRLF